MWLFVEERLKQNDFYKAFPLCAKAKGGKGGCFKTN
jgi:hypothetical protein